MAEQKKIHELFLAIFVALFSGEVVGAEKLRTPNEIVITPAVVGIVSESSIPLAVVFDEKMTYDLSAIDLDKNGVEGQGTVNWIVQNPQLLSIQSNDTENRSITITAEAAGTTTIIAEVAGVQSSPVEIVIESPNTGEFEVLKSNLPYIKRLDHSFVAAIGDNQSNITHRISSFSGGFFVEATSISDPEIDRLRTRLKPGDNLVDFKANPIDGGSLPDILITKQLSYFDGFGGVLRFTDLEQVASLNLTSNPLLNFEESFSMTFWVKPEAALVVGVPFFTGKGAFDWEFSLNPGHGLSEFNFLDRDLTENRIVVGGKDGNSTLNEWRHVAIVFEKSSNLLTFFEDGFQRSSITLPSIPNSSGESEITISNFIGRLDELRFWNVALGSSDILDEIRSPNPTDDSRSAGYFRFDNRRAQVISSDDDTSSSIFLGIHRGHDVKDPKYGFSSEVVTSRTMTSSDGGRLRIDGEELRRFDVQGDLEIVFSPNTYDSDRTIEVEISDSNSKGFGYREEYALPISPMFRIHHSPEVLEVFPSQNDIHIKLPFHLDELDEADIDDLRVYHTHFSTNISTDVNPFSKGRPVSVVKPIDVDVSRGEITIKGEPSGSYWVSLEVPEQQKIEYVVPQFSSHPRNHRRRFSSNNYFSEIRTTSSSQFINVPFQVLNGEYSGDLVFICDGPGNSGNSFPSDLTLLVNFHSRCIAKYEKELEEYEVFFSFLDNLFFKVIRE